MTGQSGSARKYPRYSVRQENGKWLVFRKESEGSAEVRMPHVYPTRQLAMYAAGVDRVAREEPWNAWLTRTRKEARG